MGKRNKEDDKIERTIRALLKLPENKRCINCNSLGPQYVCTTFLTFICTNCSGIHREFTHRVKSVSMARFTAEEVTALQTGGNERAREIYFKNWDVQRNSLPDGSNLQRLRDFIRNVYVDRKYTGERTDKLPMLRLAKSEDFSGSRKLGSYFDAKSPSYEDRYEQKNCSPTGRSDERTFKCYFDERSTKDAQENSRYGGSRRNAVRFEIVDNRIRDTGSGSSRRHESLGFPDRECKSEIWSPNLQKNIDSSKSPTVQPVRDILGKNVPGLHVGENSEMNTRKNAGGSADNKNITSSGSQKSVDRNILEHKKGNLESLIDFDLDSEPSNAVAMLNAEQMPAASIEGGNQLSCELSLKEKTAQASNANTLEFLLFDLSTPAPSGVTVDNMSAALGTFFDAQQNASEENVPLAGVSAAGSPEKLLLLTNDFGSSTTEPITNLHVKPSVGPPQAVNDKSGGYNNKVPDGPQLPTMYHDQPSAFHASYGSSSAQGTTEDTALNNQPYTSSLRDGTQGPSNVSSDQSIQVISRSTRDTNCGIGIQTLSAESESSGRKELPADLFTASHSSVPAAVPGWQTSLPHGMQYYPRAMHVSGFPNTVKPTNPFDFNSETAATQVPSFPSMTSLQGAIPNVSAPTHLLHASSFGAHHPGLMISNSPSYNPMMSPQSSFGTYTVEQSHSASPRQEGTHGFAGAGAISGSLITMPRPTDGYSAATPNYFHTLGGNPFG
ncbi:hypothetical protein SLE2022_270580 [Rubroshorea leprosula]